MARTAANTTNNFIEKRIREYLTLVQKLTRNTTNELVKTSRPNLLQDGRKGSGCFVTGLILVVLTLAWKVMKTWRQRKSKTWYSYFSRVLACYIQIKNITSYSGRVCSSCSSISRSHSHTKTDCLRFHNSIKTVAHSDMKRAKKTVESLSKRYETL